MAAFLSAAATASGISGQPGQGAAAAAQGEDYVNVGDGEPRFVVFIAGGMTYSEARSVYEVSGDKSKNCYIGSTQFLTPQSFVHELNTLSKTPEKAAAMEEEYDKKLEELCKPKKKGEEDAAGAATAAAKTA